MAAVGINAFYKGAGANPYTGDIGKGIDYDTFEAMSNFIEHTGSHSSFSTVYHAGARRLAKHLDVAPKTTLADIGCGTGIAALEALLPRPAASIQCIEPSDGMRTIAEYKFGKNDGAQIQHATDPALRAYWERFRDLARGFSPQVTFQPGDIRKLPLADASLDGAIANQVLHWMPDDTQLGKAFGEVHRVLRDGASLVWTTSSHFYDHAAYPSAEYAFNNNAAFAYFFEDLSKRTQLKLPYQETVPRHQQDSVRALTAQHGLTTAQVGTFIHDFDLRILLAYHIPRTAHGFLSNQGVPQQDAQRLVAESIAAIINKPEVLDDTKRRYCIVPILKSTKQ